MFLQVNAVSSVHNIGKSQGGNYTARKGIINTNPAHTTTRFCNNGINKLEIPLGYNYNVVTFNLAPGYHKF